VRLPERLRSWAFTLLFCLCTAAHADERVLELASGEVLRYRLVEGAAGSARLTAQALLRHLAQGDLAEAAQLSNAPARRLEEFATYRSQVGEEEFRRVFARYRENRLVAEIAIETHRLLIWQLADAGNRLAGQYYVELNGRFLMDDVPNQTRSQLRRVLEAYRSGKLRFSE